MPTLRLPLPRAPRAPSPSRRAAARLALALAALCGGAVLPVQAQGGADTLLNVSYDVSRELYKDLNPLFIAAYQAGSGRTLAINQSHGGSSAQAQAVINGLDADVVTMNQALDLDKLAEAGAIAKDWRQRFPHGAAPYTSPTVFLVRKGNPKQLKDWADLARPGVSVIVPNPKTSGNGRYTYLAAWGSVVARGGSEAQARDFVARLLANVPVLDGGGRGATTTFTQRKLGDVLITFENEAALIANQVGAGQFELVYPSLTIEAEAPVALVEKVAARKGAQEAARAYLAFLFTPPAQAVIARHGLRPRDPAVAKANAERFPAVRTFTVDSALGGWPAVFRTHFADGGLYDQLVVKR